MMTEYLDPHNPYAGDVAFAELELTSHITNCIDHKIWATVGHTSIEEMTILINKAINKQL